MSNNPAPGAPPRPQVKYNLAALRLAQSANSDAQGPQIHVVSTAPPRPSVTAGSTASAASPPNAGGSVPFSVLMGGGTAGSNATAAKPAIAAHASEGFSASSLLAALQMGGGGNVHASSTANTSSSSPGTAMPTAQIRITAPPPPPAPSSVSPSSAHTPSSSAAGAAPPPQPPPQPRSLSSSLVQQPPSTPPHGMSATAWGQPPCPPQAPAPQGPPAVQANPAPFAQPAPSMPASMKYTPPALRGNPMPPGRPVAMPVGGTPPATLPQPLPIPGSVPHTPPSNLPSSNPMPLPPSGGAGSLPIPQPRRADPMSMPGGQPAAFMNAYPQSQQPPPQQQQYQQPPLQQQQYQQPPPPQRPLPYDPMRSNNQPGAQPPQPPQLPLPGSLPTPHSRQPQQQQQPLYQQQQQPFRQPPPQQPAFPPQPAQQPLPSPSAPQVSAPVGGGSTVAAILQLQQQLQQQQQPPQQQPSSAFIPAPRTQQRDSRSAAGMPNPPPHAAAPAPLLYGGVLPPPSPASAGVAMQHTPPAPPPPLSAPAVSPSPLQQLPHQPPQMAMAPPQPMPPFPMPQPMASQGYAGQQPLMPAPMPQAMGVGSVTSLSSAQYGGAALAPTQVPYPHMPAAAAPPSPAVSVNAAAVSVTTPPAAAATAALSPSSVQQVSQVLDVQQVLQRMGIQAHIATSPPSAPAAGASAAFAAASPAAGRTGELIDPIKTLAAVVPSATISSSAGAVPTSPEQQFTQRQEQQQVPLNFYGGPRGSAAAPQYPQQQQQQYRQQQPYPQQNNQQGYGPRRGGGGGGGYGSRPPYNNQYPQQFQQQQQQQQPSRYERGRGPSAIALAREARIRPPPAPVSHRTDPDPETVKRFVSEYAQQEDTDGVGEELRAQQISKLGTVGTLDEEVCLSLIESHDVTFVVTDTGTGKSTRIPIALHKAHPDALVVNAQPRRTAAINLAQRVAEVLGVKLGEMVGYSVRGEHIGDLGETKVMYVTTYSLFIFFLWHEFKETLPFTYIIVDEFHERTPDVEVILLMLKLWLKKHPGAFKLVLCSATAQVAEWHDFFDGLTIGTYARSPIMYPVREYFIEDLQKLIGIRTPPIEPQDSNNMVTSEQMHQLILVCKQLLEYLAKNTATQDSVLVFMPGRTQVELMTTWIRDNLEESLEPIAWYRDVELSVIQEALARPAVTRKKVYVATDIAEVSLTLPDVVFVIDSGTGKRPQVSAKEQTSYAFPPLRLLWETTSNSQQRRGRVGRVQQGFYFSLLSKEHHTTLLQGSENRIKNAVLTELVLHSLLITQKPFAFFQLCNERPERGALAYSLHLLQDSGMIIRKDDPLADAERVALDRQRTTHVRSSPWSVLIEEALADAQEEAPPQASEDASAEATPHGTSRVTKAAAKPATEEEAVAAPKQQEQQQAEGAPAASPAAKAKSGKEEDGDAAESDDDDDVVIPEAEDEAFQQCYFMTLRGVLAARAPVSVAAATNIFYGLVCGTPTLSMLAAAIESCKSPFHVPYTINDRVERASMVRAVSEVMQRYHGSLQSDLICAMEVILEYMSMQRDGLSEEAQEEWCHERSVSRTRIVDTLNLFAQMKEQVSSVLPFPDVTDIDVLTAQFNQNAEVLVLMLVASHTELAIQVQLDGWVAQQKGFVGHGLFFPLKCLKDESVPTVCPWSRTKISVPLSLQTIQRKVLAVFSSQVEPDLFALVVLIFSFKLRYTVLEGGPAPSYLMSVSHSGVRRTFQCDVLTAQQILQLRRIQCAQLRCMQLQVEERVKASESEKLTAVLKSAKSDFGLPDSAMQTPYLIPTVLQLGLKLLVERLRKSLAFATQKRLITDFPPGTAYCQLQNYSVTLSPPILQSVLIHSNNGLSVVEPLASPVSAATTTPVEGNGRVEPTPPSATPAAEKKEEEEEEEEDDMSDKSTDSDSEVHVATFRYDL